MINWVKHSMRGGAVKRYHTIPTLGDETVGEHSFGVAMMVLAITDQKASAELLKAALFHDMAEQVTGDSPFTSKSSFPMLKCAIEIAEEEWEKENGYHIELSARDKRVLKWGDMLQLLSFCSKQKAMGNSFMDKVFANGVKFLNKMEPEGRGPEILGWLVHNYRS